MWRGGLGSAYRLPALSVAGASLSGPCSVSTSRSSNRTCLFQASVSRRRLTQSPRPLHVTPPATSENSLRVIRLIANLPFYRRFLRPPSRVAHGPPHCVHAVANTPAGRMELVRSSRSTNFGLPTNRGGSAPALSVSGPAQHSLTLLPTRSPSRLATLGTRGFSSLVASTAALIATGWSEPVPGRVYPRCGPPPFHGALRMNTYTKSGENSGPIRDTWPERRPQTSPA